MNRHWSQVLYFYLFLSFMLLENLLYSSSINLLLGPIWPLSPLISFEKLVTGQSVLNKNLCAPLHFPASLAIRLWLYVSSGQ